MSRNISINEAVQRIQALNQFAEETGVRLPFRAGFILAQELRGHTVDLTTGAITLNQSGVRVRATLAGQAEGGAL